MSATETAAKTEFSRAHRRRARLGRSGQQAVPHRVLDAVVDVRRENGARAGGVALERAGEQLVVLLGGDLPAVDPDDHLVAKVLVVDWRMRVEQRRRAASRDQRAVELPVVLLP